jgi:RNA polymerase sigma-70 factor (ECF subfamily)
MSSQEKVGLMLEHMFRHQAGRMVAMLTRQLGPTHLELAEESVQDAMMRALQTWPHHGVPENAEGWLFRVAHHAAIDQLRRGRKQDSSDNLDEVIADLSFTAATVMDDPRVEERLRDDELRMIFMCCHPSLSRDSRVALSLKTVGGFSVREIARAFLEDETTIAQRLVRAKGKIRKGDITLEMPSGDELNERLDSVLEVLYFMFNEGYTAHEGEDLIRNDLCFEALRLGQLCATASVAAPRVHALMALMAFQAARLPARTDSTGELVLLEEQDHSRWDQKLIALGFHHFEQSMNGDEISEYHAQAAIAATYARAEDAKSIDWEIILALYDQLSAMQLSPVVALNRAVVVAKVHGPSAGLEAIRAFDQNALQKLRDYHLLLAVRGRLLLELGMHGEAAESLRAALQCPCCEPERRFLRRTLAACEAGEEIET